MVGGGGLGGTVMREGDLLVGGEAVSLVSSISSSKRFMSTLPKEKKNQDVNIQCVSIMPVNMS